MNLTNDRSKKIIVALDVPSLEEARALVQKLKGHVGLFKIGKELFTSVGPGVVQAVREMGCEVFLDLKFHDIPNTVGAACAAATRLGVFMTNVHASGGKKMMIQAVQSAHKVAAETGKKPPLLLAVTVLTSLIEKDLKEVGVCAPVELQVERLAALAKESGLDGVVASPQEIEAIRKKTGDHFVIVTPGVRPVWAAQGDQKRIMTPKEALDRGADYLVIGRPITAHPDPAEAAQKIIEEIA